MKIAITSSGLGHIARGIETWSKELAYSLWNKGLNITLYKGAGRKESKIEKNIPCIKRYSKPAKIIHKFMPSFSWRFGFGSKYQIEATTFTMNLIPELIAKKYDIIHTQEASSAIILEYLRKIKSIKSKIVLAHGTNESMDFLAQFEVIQHLTPYDFYKFNGKLENKKRFIIPNFVDTEAFNPCISSLKNQIGIKNDVFVILTVGMVTEGKYKNMLWLIRELSKIKKRRKIFLIIVGSATKDTRKVIEFGKESLKDNISFMLNYPHNLMPKIYTSADLFVLCSLEEMMPVALLEALSSGLTSICHRHPVMEWIIGEGGECIDMAKEGELAKTIEKYYLDKDLRAQKSEKAREQAIKNFSKDVVVDKIINMYREVMRM